MNASGLESVFLENRERLLRFLVAHGAGDAAEDLLQELWIRIAGSPRGPIGAPLSYLYRSANNLMLDRHRADRQASRRDHAWADSAGPSEAGISDAPRGERVLIAREALGHAQAALDALGPRTAAIFRRHRIEGVAQREIAAEYGLSLSTIESELRKAYQALIEARRKIEEA
jgi:RNA polymerase sigma factor (sigma-70 family)